MKRVLVANHKHGKTVFDISTKERRDLVSLFLVKRRIKEGTYQDPGEAPRTYAEEDLQKIPAGLRELAREVAQRNRWQSRLFPRDKRLWDDANKAVATDDGALAWQVLVARSDCEYEGIEDHEILEVVNPLRPSEEEVELQNLRYEIRRLDEEVEKWKRRAAKHGCNVDTGDPDCG
jgi:hypothetical protein